MRRGGKRRREERGGEGKGGGEERGGEGKEERECVTNSETLFVCKCPIVPQPHGVQKANLASDRISYTSLGEWLISCRMNRYTYNMTTVLQVERAGETKGGGNRRGVLMVEVSDMDYVREHTPDPTIRS